MQQYASTDPTEEHCKRLGDVFARILEKRAGVSMPMDESLAWMRYMAIGRLRRELQEQQQLAMRFGKRRIDPGEVRHSSLSEEEQRYIDFLSPLEPGLTYLFRLLMCRCARYMARWRGWLLALASLMQSDVGWTSLLPAWSPWTGRAPPVVPQVIQRQ